MDLLRGLRDFEPDTYVEDDMYRPTCEGRSLHDGIGSFYRNVMEMTTPIKNDDLPTRKELCNAIEVIAILKKTQMVSLGN